MTSARLISMSLIAMTWLLPSLLGMQTALAQTTRYVATDGIDQAGRGSAALPYASVTFALDQAAAGDTILVKPGTYTGRIRIRGNFTSEVVVRSEQPYQARLRAAETVLTIFHDSNDIRNIAIEGFDIAHTGAGASALVVQIQDGFGRETRDIRLQNNILHDSHNNDILKINNGASNIVVRGNMFYNQSGSDEHIDINSVDTVLVEDNVFFNNFASSGRSNGNNTSSYIVVKDSNAGDDEYLGARNVTIRRNVFLNWEGSSGSNFILFGEDGTSNHEAFDCLVENNLLLGNSANTMRAAFGVKGSRDIRFRANTVVGDLPSLAYAMRLNREGSNPLVSDIRFHNNIWADPTGSMNDFSDTPPADSQNIVLQRNGIWNGGAALPEQAGDAINPSSDAERVTGDPRLANPAGLQTPHWLPGSNQFNGGFSSIRQAFLALVESYAVVASGGAGIDQALASEMPLEDIRGLPRSGAGDLGAYEISATFFRDGFEATLGSP